MSVPVRIHSLLCKKDISVARICYGSLFDRVLDDVHLTIHDDGSLTEAEIDVLNSVSQKIDFIPRVMADEVVSDKLIRYPKILEFRDNNVFALKLIDQIIFCNGDHINYIDSDVFFIEPVAVFRPANDFVFMHDNWNAISVAPLDSLVLRKIPLLKKLNAGMFQCSLDCIDLDYLEYLSSQSALFHGWPGWREQTLWNALAAQHGARLWDPIAVRMADGSANYNGAAIIHFVATWRSELFALTSTLFNDQRSAQPLRAIPTLPADRLTLGEFVMERSRRAVRNRLSKVLPKRFP
jgi:hypothetical protein